MIDDVVDETDDNIVGFLPDSSHFSAFVPNGIYLDGRIQATKANLKALGLTWLDDAFSATDAFIEFNSAHGFDFDSTDGIGSGLMDFEAVATHEIGHVLGFTSSVDFIDELVYLGITDYLVSVRPLDLFRFYDDFSPTTPEEFSILPRSLVPWIPSHFNDLTHQYSMSTGQYLGDGWQAGHWKESELSGNIIGIMDPAVLEGEQVAISEADIRALDVIGWDYKAPIPEPGSLVLLSIGLASLGFMRRQMRNASTII